MNDSRTNQHRLGDGDARAHANRGMAIMLVLFCIAAASIMAAAYVVSRENAPQLTSNVVSGSTARTAAATGLSMANAILECEVADWRASTVNGVLLSDVPVGDGTVTVTVSDVNGGLPTRDTLYVKIRAVGKHNDMVQVAEAVAYVARDQPKADPTFSEFAIFGTDHIDITDSIVTRWEQSPKAAVGLPIWLGTNAAAGSNIVLTGATQLVDPQIVARSDVGSAILRDNRPTTERIRIESVAGATPLPVPLPASANTAVCTPSPTPNVNITSGSVISNDSWILSSVRVADTGVVRVNAPSLVTRWVQGNVTIENGGRFIVDSDHDFVIDGNLTIRNSSGICVSDGVKCRIFVGGNVTIEHGSFGVSLVRAATITDPRDGLGLYKPPGECKLYEKPGSTGKTWTIDTGAVVVAQLYAPNATINIAGGSCCMGSILGQSVAMSGGSVLHYDHALDQRGGYTNAYGPLYITPGNLDTDLLALATDLNDSTIALLNGAIVTDAAPAPAGGASPRNRRVQWRMHRFGISPVWDRDRFANVGEETGNR